MQFFVAWRDDLYGNTLSIRRSHTFRYLGGSSVGTVSSSEPTARCRRRRFDCWPLHLDTRNRRRNGEDELPEGIAEENDNEENEAKTEEGILLHAVAQSPVPQTIGENA